MYVYICIISCYKSDLKIIIKEHILYFSDIFLKILIIMYIYCHKFIVLYKIVYYMNNQYFLSVKL